MPSLSEIWDWLNAFVAFGANLVTLILGVIAVWALIFHRQKVSLLFSVLVSTFLNDRVKRIRETLGKLDFLNFDNKEDRAEVIALLGQVCGQIKPLTDDESGLKPIHEELLSVLEKKTRLSEATKRRVIYELHGVLDGVSYAKTREILEIKK